MALILLYIELGVASLIGGAALLLLLLPPNLIGGKFVEKIQRKQLIAKDHRIKVKMIFSTVHIYGLTYVSTGCLIRKIATLMGWYKKTVNFNNQIKLFP